MQGSRDFPTGNLKRTNKKNRRESICGFCFFTEKAKRTACAFRGYTGKIPRLPARGSEKDKVQNRISKAEEHQNGQCQTGYLQELLLLRLFHASTCSFPEFFKQYLETFSVPGGSSFRIFFCNAARPSATVFWASANREV